MYRDIIATGMSLSMRRSLFKKTSSKVGFTSDAVPAEHSESGIAQAHAKNIFNK